jgi:hypothetical protein
MMQEATNKNIYKFLLKVDDIGKVPISESEMTKTGLELTFKGKLNASQQKKLKEDLSKLLSKNFSGEFDLGKTKVVNDKFKLWIDIEQIGTSGPVPTEIQEAGSAFVMTQVIKYNKKFVNANDILNDLDTKNGLEKIFKTNHKNSIRDWTHSYFEHQQAFFKKFQPSQWDIFEHGGQDFMTFIKERARIVKEFTPSGQVKDIGRYETWNPSDIWAVKDKNKVKSQIDDSIQRGENQTLTELNNVLLNLMKDNKLIGLSLKKIESRERANFSYVNKDPKSIEFAEVEKVKDSDISVKISTKSNKDGMSQGGYVLFGKYTINIIRTPTDTFSNLKFESVVKGSGGRGGAAPVKLVEDMLKDKVPRHTFVNVNKNYPKTTEEFERDKRDYKKMYDILKSNIEGTKDYFEFKDAILAMYNSGNKKTIAIAQSKLMQLHFFSDVASKCKGKESEFWTDLLYLSLKVGNRFAPHGKLS